MSKICLTFFNELFKLHPIQEPGNTFEKYRITLRSSGLEVSLDLDSPSLKTGMGFSFSKQGKHMHSKLSPKNAKKATATSKAKMRQRDYKNILVVGDWLVDEHWLVGVHRSSSSSRVGNAHYRALHSIDSVVTTFCGAGMPASLLHQIKNKDTSKGTYKVFGLGYWHVDDDDILKSMFDLSHKTLSPYKLTHKADPNPEIYLKNLCCALTDEDKKKVTTTRIIREYHDWVNSESDVKYYRTDWEPDLSNLQLIPDDRELSGIINKLATKNIDAVLIKDMGKGVISDNLIDKLTNNDKLKKSKWFVSSKAWKPAWFEHLTKVDLRLLLIPQVSAQRAVKEEALSCWITHKGLPDKSAYKVIESLYDTVCNSAGELHRTLLVVLPDEYSMIACNLLNRRDKSTTTPKDQIYTITDSSSEKLDVVVQSVAKPCNNMPVTGMASILLPVITNELMKLGNELKMPNNSISLKGITKDSLLHTFNWASILSNNMLDGNRPAEKFLNENLKIDIENSLNLNFNELSFAVEQKKWEISSTGIGVIKFNRKHQLELWRSTVDVGGYVCLEETRRKQIRRLIDALKEFKNGNRKHHIGCMLVADPGSGKTYLARKLANSLGIRFLQFNITQMIEPIDILNCFDEIVVVQSTDRIQPILIYVDEINATMAKESVYGAFLAPLEDGTYIKNGREFHIDPCFWLFSGTRHLTEHVVSSSNDSESTSDKKSDFLSRLSLGELSLSRKRPLLREPHLQHENETGTEIKVENVYIGVSLLKNEYSDVKQISKGVLKLFYHMPMNVGVRDMKHLVKLFTDIQYNKVKLRNIPDTNKIPEQLYTLLTADHHVKNILDEKVKEDENMVDIVD